MVYDASAGFYSLLLIVFISILFTYHLYIYANIPRHIRIAKMVVTVDEYFFKKYFLTNAWRSNAPFRFVSKTEMCQQWQPFISYVIILNILREVSSGCWVCTAASNGYRALDSTCRLIISTPHFPFRFPNEHTNFYMSNKNKAFNRHSYSTYTRLQPDPPNLVRAIPKPHRPYHTP